MQKVKLYILSLLLCACINHSDDKQYELPIFLDAVDYKVNLLILDTDNNVIPSSNIVFEGDLSNKIATSEGRTGEFTAVDGVFSFGVLSNYSTSFDENTPESINLSIQADGYDIKNQKIIFDGTNQSEILKVVLKRKGEKVEGVTEEIKEESLRNGKLIEEIKVITETEENITLLTVKEETEFVTVEGSILRNDEVIITAESFERQFVYEGVHFENSNKTLFSFFPDGTYNSLGESTNYLMPLAPIYHFSFETSTGREIKEFTKNVTIRTYLTIINEVNPNTGVLLSIGDLVDIYVKENINDDFVEIPSAEIKYDGLRGQNYIEFETNQTGYYEFGFTMNNTGTCGVFDEVILRNEGKSSDYILMAVTEQGTTIGGVALQLTGDSSVKGKSLNRFKALSSLFNAGLHLIVLNYNKETHQFEEVYNEQKTFCDLNNDIVDISSIECSKEYNLDLKFSCEGLNILMNDYPVYFKEQEADKFELFQYIKDGYIKGYGPCLDSNKYYEFKVSFDGQNRVSDLILGEYIDDLYIDFDQEDVCEELSNDLNIF